VPEQGPPCYFDSEFPSSEPKLSSIKIGKPRRKPLLPEKSVGNRAEWEYLPEIIPVSEAGPRKFSRQLQFVTAAAGIISRARATSHPSQCPNKAWAVFTSCRPIAADL
jgi:hypothetical protein